MEHATDLSSAHGVNFTPPPPLPLNQSPMHSTAALPTPPPWPSLFVPKVDLILNEILTVVSFLKSNTKFAAFLSTASATTIAQQAAGAGAASGSSTASFFGSTSLYAPATPSTLPPHLAATMTHAARTNTAPGSATLPATPSLSSTSAALSATPTAISTRASTTTTTTTTLPTHTSASIPVFHAASSVSASFLHGGSLLSLLLHSHAHTATSSTGLAQAHLHLPAHPENKPAFIHTCAALFAQLGATHLRAKSPDSTFAEDSRTSSPSTLGIESLVLQPDEDGGLAVEAKADTGLPDAPAQEFEAIAYHSLQSGRRSSSSSSSDPTPSRPSHFSPPPSPTPSVQKGRPEEHGNPRAIFPYSASTEFFDSDVPGFEELCRRLAQPHASISPLFLATPFLRVIQSGDLSAQTISATLAALESFIAHDLFQGAPTELTQVLHMLILTMISAQFEVSEATHDELVLWRLVALLRRLFQSPLLPYLDPTNHVQIFKLTLSIWTHVEFSEPLRRAAEAFFLHFVRTLFESTQRWASQRAVLEILHWALDTCYGTLFPHLAPAASAAHDAAATAVAASGAPATHESLAQLFTCSEALVVLALQLLQAIVAETPEWDPRCRDYVTDVLFADTLRLLTPASAPSPAPKTWLGASASGGVGGIGLDAPLSHKPVASKSLNMRSMLWRTLHVFWRHMYPHLHASYPRLLHALLASTLAGKRNSASSSSKDAEEDDENVEDDGGDEAWEVRETRLQLLQAVIYTPGLLPYVFQTMDADPDQDNWFARVVEYFRPLLSHSHLHPLGFHFLEHFFALVEQSVPNAALREAKLRKHALEHGLALFRTSPKRALEYLVQQGLLEATPAATARFLFRTRHLDPRRIGELISKPNQHAVLAQYMAHFAFAGLPIDAALRVLMLKFRLPGESQLIDRILEAFAHHFCLQNPGQRDIANQDAALILAFSIIMLNTDQHNPQVKHRMTLEHFCRNLRGLNGGNHFATSFLETIYTRIKEKEIKSATAWLPDPQPSLPRLPFWKETLRWDTEAMLHEVYDVLLLGLLHVPLAHATAQKVMLHLHVLAHQPSCFDRFFKGVATFYRLTPIARKADMQKKLVLNHAHVVLLFSLLFHRRFDLSSAAKHLAVDTIANLFLYNYLPESITTFHDVIRQRDVRIHLNTLSPSTSPTETPFSEAKPSASSSNSAVASPYTPVATQPRAGTSLFSFFSYLSTTFQYSEPAMDEDQATMQALFSTCEVAALMRSVADVEALLDLLPKYPVLTGFFMHWAAELLLETTVTATLVHRYIEQWRAYAAAHPSHAVHLFFMLCPRYPELHVLSPLVAKHVPLDALVHVPALPFTLLLPSFTPQQYVALLQRHPEHLPALLRGHDRLALGETHWKQILELVDFQLVKSRHAKAIQALLLALLECAPVFAHVRVELLALTLYARMVFHPTVGPSMMVYLERALMVLHGHDPMEIFQHVLAPLTHKLHGEQRQEDQVRMYGLLCKWFVHLLDRLSPELLVQLWDTLVSEILAYLQVSEYLADTVVNSLMNAILVMDSQGLLIANDGRVNAMWTFTWSKISPVLPSLKAEMFPDRIEHEEGMEKTGEPTGDPAKREGDPPSSVLTL